MPSPSTSKTATPKQVGRIRPVLPASPRAPAPAPVPVPPKMTNQTIDRQLKGAFVKIHRLLWPDDGLAVLKVGEVAARWRCTDQHISDLIEGGHLAALDLAGKGSSRRSYRIPRAAYEWFLQANHTLFDPKTGQILTPAILAKTPQDDLPPVPPAKTNKRPPVRLPFAAVGLPVRDLGAKNAPRKGSQ